MKFVAVSIISAITLLSVGCGGDSSAALALVVIEETPNCGFYPAPGIEFDENRMDEGNYTNTIKGGGEIHVEFNGGTVKVTSSVNIFVHIPTQDEIVFIPAGDNETFRLN